MSLLDGVMLFLMCAMGVALWFYGECSGWLDWLIKFALLASFLFGPYFFWDDIGAYWKSSPDGPVNLEQGWF